MRLENSLPAAKSSPRVNWHQLIHCSLSHFPPICNFSFFSVFSVWNFGLPQWLRGKRICLPMLETWVWFLGQEDLLEKDMATHSSIPAWEIPWTEEPGGLHTVPGVARVGHDWTTKQQQRRITCFGRHRAMKNVSVIKSAYQFVLLWQLLPHLSQFFTQFPKIWHKRVKNPGKLNTVKF